MGKEMGMEIVVVHEDPGAQTTVLWVSRHSPLKAQIQQLKTKLGAVRIVQVRGIVPNAETVIEIAKQYGASIIVPVLPLSMIARLVELGRKQNLTILFARMEAIAQVRSIEEAQRLVAEKPEARTFTTYADGSVKVHEFRGFEVIKAVQIVTEPW